MAENENNDTPLHLTRTGRRESSQQMISLIFLLNVFFSIFIPW